MSKAVLIMNEYPERCIYCNYLDVANKFCRLTMDCIKDPSVHYNRCPLAELPESYELPDWITEDDIDHYSSDREQEVAYFLGYYDGWNECLDEIQC